LLVEANTLFEDDFLGRVLFRDVVRVLFAFGETSERLTHKAMLVFQVAAGDFLAFRVGGKPAFAATQEFLDFIFANPIVLFVVEDRKQDVKMLKSVSQALLCGERDGPIETLAPLGKFVVEGMATSCDCVTEWLEQAMEEPFAAATRKNRDANFERKFRVGKFLFRFAAAAECGAKGAREGHARERRRNVRAVVDVLVEQAAFAGGSTGLANQLDGINFDQECGGAAVFSGFWVEDVRFAKRERDRV
jgi:hypothetical protein